MAESTDFVLLGAATTPHWTFEIALLYGKNPICERIYGFFRTEVGYFPLYNLLSAGKRLAGMRSAKRGTATFFLHHI